MIAKGYGFLLGGGDENVPELDGYTIVTVSKSEELHTLKAWVLW